MEEIEVKILEVNRKECEKVLLNLGAVKKFEGEMHAFNFDFEDNNIRNNNQVIRLRKEGNNQVLCFKELISKEEAKRMTEIEVDVSDFDKTKFILEKLGLKAWKESKKTRVSYKLNNIVFDFDKYHGEYEFIPEFLEIEATNIEAIKEYALKLGFKENQLKPWNFKDLLKHHTN